MDTHKKIKSFDLSNDLSINQPEKIYRFLKGLKGKSSPPKLILKQELILTDISLFLFHVPFFTFQELNIAYPR